MGLKPISQTIYIRRLFVRGLGFALLKNQEGRHFIFADFGSAV